MLARIKTACNAHLSCTAQRTNKNMKNIKIKINELNSAGIKAHGKIHGITEVVLIGTNGKIGDENTSAYYCGGERVIATNGDPIWEEQDHAAFAAMMEEIEA